MRKQGIKKTITIKKAIKTRIGKVLYYGSEGDEALLEEADGETGKLRKIVEQYGEADYHGQIAAEKSYTAMYQLAETRGNIVEWMHIFQGAKVLELGAGCGSITSVLLQQGAKVTCQEDNVCYARLNALRHKEESRLTVYAMPLWMCEQRLDWDYDVVVMIGTLTDTEQDGDELLQHISAHLKPEGILIAAVENQFGLKYWAGNKDQYTHSYFAGLEGRSGAQKDRKYNRYTRKRLLESFSRAGYHDLQLYYPYPDHRFALHIYSDSYLPNKGDLSYNIANYEDDRILLFDEQKVYDSIIEEGQFPFFSNSYLCIGKKEAMGIGLVSDIQYPAAVYARYASDRGREYAACTEIIGISSGAGPEESPELVVLKRPLYQEGTGHIRHIVQAWESLDSQYKDTGLQFNRCQLIEEEGQTVCAVFEFLWARALQEEVEQAVALQDMEKIFDILHRMMQYIRNGKNTQTFTRTEAFTRVFGEIPTEVLESALCTEVSDIDLILPNILVDGAGNWHVIDYEWTFEFPIPQDFIIYRTLFFLNHENPQQEELSMERLLGFASITEEEAAVYAQMEEGFQRFVAGGIVPYREMVNLLGRRFMDIPQLEADYSRVVAQNDLLKGKGLWKLAKKVKDRFTARHQDT